MHLVHIFGVYAFSLDMDIAFWFGGLGVRDLRKGLKTAETPPSTESVLHHGRGQGAARGVVVVHVLFDEVVHYVCRFACSE